LSKILICIVFNFSQSLSIRQTNRPNVAPCPVLSFLPGHRGGGDRSRSLRVWVRSEKGFVLVLVFTAGKPGGRSTKAGRISVPFWFTSTTTIIDYDLSTLNGPGCIMVNSFTTMALKLFGPHIRISQCQYKRASIA
jgi:hypothetical protein